MENKVLTGYGTPLKNDPNFIVAMTMCNKARDEFIPLRKQGKIDLEALKKYFGAKK